MNASKPAKCAHESPPRAPRASRPPQPLGTSTGLHEHHLLSYWVSPLTHQAPHECRWTVFVLGNVRVELQAPSPCSTCPLTAHRRSGNQGSAHATCPSKTAGNSTQPRQKQCSNNSITMQQRRRELHARKMRGSEWVKYICKSLLHDVRVCHNFLLRTWRRRHQTRQTSGRWGNNFEVGTHQMHSAYPRGRTRGRKGRGISPQRFFSFGLSMTSLLYSPRICRRRC